MPLFSSGKAFCMCSTHVDDIFVLFNKGGKIFKEKLFCGISATIKLENLGPVSWALKTLILRDRKRGVIKFPQEKFKKTFLGRDSTVPPPPPPPPLSPPP